VIVKMSKYMLSDQNTMDDMNPFVQRDFSLPGAIGKPDSFKKYVQPREKDVDFMNDNTHICKFGATSGDKVVETCRPSKVKCRLSRSLLPGRNIDMGVGKTRENTKEYFENNQIRRNYDTRIMLVIVIIILLLSSLKR
jgi:hypothetical protein